MKGGSEVGRYSTETLKNAALLLLESPRQFYRQVLRFFRPMRGDYRKRFRMSLRQWLLYHQRNVVLKECHWMGVRALKNPLDAWIYQEILCEVRPDVVVEIGSLEGGGTLYLANLLDLLGKGIVISVDIDRSKFNVKHSRIIEITGHSSSPEVLASVAELCAGKSVLVLHDGDHRKEQVLRDLQIYSKLVSVGSYFIVEDGIIDLYKPGDSIGAMDDGPLAATEEFLRANPDFVADTERERYILTYNPRGFLKRVR
jgi:cephalosporin hydroxylase